MLVPVKSPGRSSESIRIACAVVAGWVASFGLRGGSVPPAEVRSETAVWAWVPADSLQRSWGAVAVPLPAGPESVTLIGPSGRRLPIVMPMPTERPVVRLELPIGPSQGPVDAAPLGEIPDIPQGAIWLDGSDTPRIHTPGAVGGNGADGLANPWQVRAPGRASVDYPIVCNGILFGGGAEAVCWVNGVPLRRGDRASVFTIVGVRREEALLRLDDAIYVLPIGRKAVVRLIHASL